ncbi:MAG TPA: helix-turn-helix domain-containing protein [Solirubrobacteraceae bacterium]|nr:helix-turn-helix domain-containing protein [Solirubrobacteraceae bacterium]
MAIVSSAVAGDGIERVARTASEALGHPVAIILPSVGAPVVWPAGALASEVLRELVNHAVALAAGEAGGGAPMAVAHVEPIRIGREVIGIVATTAGLPANGDGEGQADWLEATAAAAAVTRLMHDGPDGDETDLAGALLGALVAAPPADIQAVLADGHRLGVDLSAGAIGICAHGRVADDEFEAEGTLVAELGTGRTVGLVPLTEERTAERRAAALAERLSAAGVAVGISAPRRQPALLHEALREAMLLAELAGAPEAAFAGQEETYRLLIGVLLRDPEEVELLRTRTISPLAAYDAEHDTELLITLATFLAHDGSTTETAEAMRLHRHTVGYRLSRVQEVSGLSPYESDGRERLSLGLKAAQILAAEERLSQPG